MQRLTKHEQEILRYRIMAIVGFESLSVPGIEKCLKALNLYLGNTFDVRDAVGQLVGFDVLEFVPGSLVRLRIDKRPASEEA
jgi:hypothetical protein